MGQTRAHEQAAHVDAALSFVNNLGTDHTVIIRPSVDDVRRNLEAKQQEVGNRLQAIHDACTDGYDIDAILRPDQGPCGDRSGKSIPQENNDRKTSSEE